MPWQVASLRHPVLEEVIRSPLDICEGEKEESEGEREGSEREREREGGEREQEREGVRESGGGEREKGERKMADRKSVV